jgi:hypothetical protein
MNCNVNAALSVEIRNEFESRCPYHDGSDICDASIGQLIPSANERITYCNTENYDNCPIFLAKVLRKR